jgi:hypothetical protein
VAATSIARTSSPAVVKLTALTPAVVLAGGAFD